MIYDLITDKDKKNVKYILEFLDRTQQLEVKESLEKYLYNYKIEKKNNQEIKEKFYEIVDIVNSFRMEDDY